MVDVIFYADRRGWEPVGSYIDELAARNDKDSRIRLQKIRDYIKYLRTLGKRAGEPYIKHVDGEIWELRPASDRIFFAAWDRGCFVLLHHIVKKTQKTPRKEIDKAKRNLSDFRERKKR
ncbi:hypothetical protein R80B4_01727 [Fibrobacteres bacterium R8-0-B4]